MAKMFMNQQFYRPLPIQRVMCVNRHENSAEPQSFPDPSCYLCTAEDLHGGATKKARAEVLGTELVPEMVILDFLLSRARARDQGDSETLFAVSLFT